MNAVHRIGLVFFILGCTFLSMIPNIESVGAPFIILLETSIVGGAVLFIIVPEDALEKK